jgi:hypothetical protein
MSLDGSRRDLHEKILQGLFLGHHFQNREVGIAQSPNQLSLLVGVPSENEGSQILIDLDLVDKRAPFQPGR